MCPRATGRKAHNLHHLCTQCIRAPSVYTHLLAFVLHPIPYIYTMHVCIIAYPTPVCWGAASLGSKVLIALGSSHMDERRLPHICCKSLLSACTAYMCVLNVAVGHTLCS